tara:strand:+ start:2078 stop:2545 length:468 start_codon:yes stop_codon:yes gene_type:complete
LQNYPVRDIEEIASKVAAENGFDLCCLNLETNGIPIVMQVQIKRTGGDNVSLDDCAKLSSPIEDAIDSSKIFSNPYTLEISSPGLSDQITSDQDFRSFKGFPVKVKFKDSRDSEKIKIGRLHEKSLNHVCINTKGKIISIPIEDVSSIQLTNESG